LIKYPINIVKEYKKTLKYYSFHYLSKGLNNNLSINNNFKNTNENLVERTKLFYLFSDNKNCKGKYFHRRMVALLIVGREIGQSVIIGDVIKVTVLQIQSKLKVVIDAPKNIRISFEKQITPRISQMKKRVRIIGETIAIGEDIKVTILQTESGLLRFAIDAPKEISIYREELIINGCLHERNCLPTF
jgi:carbon storage regulator CsrA